MNEANNSLPAPLATMLDVTYDNPTASPRLTPFPKRPRPSQLEARLAPDIHGAGNLLPVAVRAAGETWAAYAEGSVAPADFLRAPIGAPYRVEKIPGKGRGLVASRDLKAGEIVLKEGPLILLREGKLDLLMFLALPKAAVHAMMLLHNTIPNNREFSLTDDIPQHRLLDYLKGVATTNAFSAMVAADGTQAGMILLSGSLLNHSDKYNVHWEFDISAFKMVFTTVTAVKEGEELTDTYNRTAQVLKENYGI
ncbi:hypothetical protein FB451DRAFT_1386125 [Mycena latifolia]|nr:hypothetical protein FB451DRAFT_1386125 [Mycena latifolia]